MMDNDGNYPFFHLTNGIGNWNLTTIARWKKLDGDLYTWSWKLVNQSIHIYIYWSDRGILWLLWVSTYTYMIEFRTCWDNWKVAIWALVSEIGIWQLGFGNCHCFIWLMWDWMLELGLNSRVNNNNAQSHIGLHGIGTWLFKQNNIGKERLGVCYMMKSCGGKESGVERKYNQYNPVWLRRSAIKTTSNWWWQYESCISQKWFKTKRQWTSTVHIPSSNQTWSAGNSTI